MEGSIGYDLHSTQDITILPQTCTPVTTGISIQLPENTYRRITPQSGLSVKHSINIATGVIDPDYRGELKVIMVKNWTWDYEVKTGHKITQLIVEGAHTLDILLVPTLNQTERGDGGFGSMDMMPGLAEIYSVMLTHSASSMILLQEKHYQQLWSQIPNEYLDYLDVFDTDFVMSACPPTGPLYDFKIHLQENTKLPTPHHLYHLS